LNFKTIDGYNRDRRELEAKRHLQFYANPGLKSSRYNIFVCKN